MPPDRAADAGASGEWGKLRARVATQAVALTRAASRAARSGAGSEPWARAQVELSRAEQLLGDIDDLAPRFGQTQGKPRAPADLAAARAELARQIGDTKRALAR